MINNNVNVNARDRRNQTCLHMACAHGNSFVVHALLRGGAVRFFVDLIIFSIYDLLRISIIEILMDGHQLILQLIMEDLVVYKC